MFLAAPAVAVALAVSVALAVAVAAPPRRWGMQSAALRSAPQRDVALRSPGEAPRPAPCQLCGAAPHRARGKDLLSSADVSALGEKCGGKEVVLRLVTVTAQSEVF